ncbi:MAG: hypothetical protein MJZ63_06705 [Muribaculaceae bacterium]|nr:hypothetical protein [Muribaculaceae bacterium]
MVKGVFRKNRYNDRVSFNINSISQLNELKGKMLSSLSINLPEYRMKDMAPLKSLLSASTENRCDLNFKIITNDGKQYIEMRSQYKIPVTKKVLEILSEMGVEFSLK